MSVAYAISFALLAIVLKPSQNLYAETLLAFAKEKGWPAIAVDLVERLWKVRDAPDAERELALAVLRSSGELSAADLAGALGWRVKQARTVLDALDLATRREGDVVLYSIV